MAKSVPVNRNLGRDHIQTMHMLILLTLIRQPFPLGPKAFWISRHWPIVEDYSVLILALVYADFFRPPRGTTVCSP